MAQSPPSNMTKNLLSTFTTTSPVFPNKHGTVYVVQENSSILDVFKAFLTHKVLSFPVMDPKTQRAVAILSITDCMAYFLSVFTKDELKETKFMDLLHKRKELHYETVLDVIAKKTIEPIVEIPTDIDLLEAVNLMVETSAHRILVFDEEKKPYSIITQSRVVKCISLLEETIPYGKQTLRELNLGFKTVISIQDSQLAWDAFKLMIDQKVSAVAVVDDKGVVIGSLSNSDIKLLGYRVDYFEMLGRSVSNYLKALRLYDVSRTIPPNRDPVVCKETNTLHELINTVCYYRIHRIYIVDDERKPIGVVSLLDILKQVLKD